MKIVVINGVQITVPDDASSELDGVAFTPEPTGADDSEMLNAFFEENQGKSIFISPFHYKLGGTLFYNEHSIYKGFGLSTKFTPLPDAEFTEIPWRTQGNTSTIKVMMTNKRPPGILGLLKIRGIGIENLYLDGEDYFDDSGTRVGGLIFADAEDCYTENVFIKNINWKDDGSTDYRAFNLACVRANRTKFNKGMLDKAGYECLGVYDDSHDTTVTNMFIGTGMRCSAQIHQNTSNTKFNNNTLMMEVSGSYSNGCLLIHGRENAVAKDIDINHNYMYSTDGEAIFSTIEYQVNVNFESNTLYGANIAGIRTGGINIDFTLINNTINVGGIGINIAITLRGFCTITMNTIDSQGPGIHINRCDFLLITQNGVKSATHGISLNNINKGVIVDLNMFDTVGPAFDRDYSGIEEIEIGKNLGAV